jgi:hypothetical protein
MANTSAVFDGTNVTNSTFLHLKRTGWGSVGIQIDESSANINISDSVFTNISSSYPDSDLYAGAVYYNMSTSGNAYYNIKRNNFSDISTNKSMLVFNGTFSSLLFSYNTFYNFI